MHRDNLEFQCLSVRNMSVCSKHIAPPDEPGEALDAPGNASHTPAGSRKPMVKPRMRKKPPLQLVQAQQLKTGEIYCPPLSQVKRKRCTAHIHQPGLLLPCACPAEELQLPLTVCMQHRYLVIAICAGEML